MLPESKMYGHPKKLDSQHLCLFEARTHEEDPASIRCILIIQDSSRSLLTSRQ